MFEIARHGQGWLPGKVRGGCAGHSGRRSSHAFGIHGIKAQHVRHRCGRGHGNRCVDGLTRHRGIETVGRGVFPEQCFASSRLRLQFQITEEGGVTDLRMGRRGHSEAWTALLGLSAMRNWLSEIVVELARIQREVGSRPYGVKASSRGNPFILQIWQAILRGRSGQAAHAECAVDWGYVVGDPRPLLAREGIADVAVRRGALLRVDGCLVAKHVLECKGVETASRVGRQGLVCTLLRGPEHGVVVIVGQRKRVHGPRRRSLGLAASTLVLRQRSKSRVSMERVWTGDLVRHAGDVGRVVVAVARLVVAICEDGQVALGMGSVQLGFRASVVERLAAGVDLELNVLLLGTT